MRQEFSALGGEFQHGEMLLKGSEEVLPVPSGSFCWWNA